MIRTFFFGKGRRQCSLFIGLAFLPSCLRLVATEIFFYLQLLFCIFFSRQATADKEALRSYDTPLYIHTPRSHSCFLSNKLPHIYVYSVPGTRCAIRYFLTTFHFVILYIPIIPTGTRFAILTAVLSPPPPTPPPLSKPTCGVFVVLSSPSCPMPLLFLLSVPSVLSVPVAVFPVLPVRSLSLSLPVLSLCLN